MKQVVLKNRATKVSKIATPRVRVQTRNIARTTSTRITKAAASAPVIDVKRAPARTHSPLAARVAALVLISYFLLVPVADAYADTNVPSSAQGTSAVTTEPTTAAAVSQPTEITPKPDALQATAPTEASPAVVSAPSDAPATTPVPTSTPEVTSPASTTATDTSLTPATPSTTTSTTETISPRTDASTTLPTEQAGTSPTTTAATMTPATTTPLVSAVVATATPAVVPTPAVIDTANQPLVVSHTTDADSMSFAQGECVIVGTGAFQCTHRAASSSSSSHADGVYAAKDAAGVMQIYSVHNGTTDTITHTSYDNDAPALDGTNGDIVWHALLDDRYQIMRYDHKNGVTTKLTSGTVNNMLPASYDGVVVYQTWQGNDWDIVMVDRDGSSHMLTNNDEHDVAPSITDRYVTWESRENNEWVGKVYDRVSGTTQTVHGTPGSKVENPRMVLVFDAKKENGDVETVGYDVAHNKVVPLSATPAPLPKEIPQPAHQKNDQAFVQSASALKIEVKTATGTPDGTGATGTSTPPAGDIASSTSLTIPDATSTQATTSVIEATSTIATPVFIASSTAAIPDLVIEPYYATDTATTTNLQ